MSKRAVTKKKVPGEEARELQQMLQDLHSDVMDDVDAMLQKGINRIVRELELKHKKPQNSFTDKPPSSKYSEDQKHIPRKELVLRNSTLINLWKSPDARSVYNCLLACFVLLYLHIAVLYYFNVERFKRDLALFFWNFGQLDIAIAIWLALNLSIVLLLYPVFKFWASSRLFQNKKGLYDGMFFTLFILYVAAVLTIPSRMIVAYNLPPATSCALLMEQFRLAMKSYAFVRENIPRVLNYKLHQDEDEEKSNSSVCPEIGKLLYFLFAPTLIYRDSYPRTSHIRWNFVAWNISQISLMVLMGHIIFICFLANSFNKVGIEPIPITDFVGLFATAVFIGTFGIIIAIYSLECWQNAFAEMLRFGDRMFCKEWWKCTSFGKFYRAWNIVVTDFLHSYIYRDVYAILKHRTASMLFVFVLSAIFHDYIAVVALQTVIPPLYTVFFVLSIIIVVMTKKTTSNLWNFFIWLFVMIQFGLLIVFYALEWQARRSCPRVIDSWLDYVIPRFIQCNVISF